MGIARRVRTIIQANLNEAVGLVEDPEKIIKQSIRDMDEELRKARAQVLACVACEKRLESRRAAVEADAESQHRTAKAAVAGGSDEAARRALTERNRLRRECECLAAEIERQKTITVGLRQSLREFENKAAEMKRRKDSLIARKVHARARKEIHCALVGIARGQSFLDTASAEAFERMEEKIGEAEAESEAAAELAGSTGFSGPEAAMGEGGSGFPDPGVEAELEKMKGEIA